MVDRKQTIENLKRQLDKLNEDLDVLEARADQVRAEVKVSYTEQLAKLRAQRDQLSQRIGQIEQEGQELLSKLSGEFEVARSALEAGIREFRKQYKQQ